MIARFQFRLPFTLAVAPGIGLVPFDVDVAGFRVRVGVPDESRLEAGMLMPNAIHTPVMELPDLLEPAEPTVTQAVTIDGHPAFLADALQLDFVGREFDRTLGSDDPPTELAFQVANQVIAGVRQLGRFGPALPLNPGGVVWRMVYLNDDESPFTAEEGKHRSRNGAAWAMKCVGISGPLWQELAEYDGRLVRPWDDLLLDAYEVLPRVGPAVVLAATAVETRLDTALDALAPGAGFDDNFWTWITDRKGQFYKEPSLVERADNLLEAVSGQSLKGESELWEGFQQLRAARNSFVHEGVAKIGDVPVEPRRAWQLIGRAQEIVDWIERLLPEDSQRPPLPEAAVEIITPLTAPTIPATSS
jgi:hypothetical protein